LAALTAFCSDTERPDEGALEELVVPEPGSLTTDVALVTPPEGFLVPCDVATPMTINTRIASAQ